MNDIEKEQLKTEIQHIFDSGANEIRIFEMVKSFIESRNVINKLPIHNVIDRKVCPKAGICAVTPGGCTCPKEEVICPL